MIALAALVLLGQLLASRASRLNASLVSFPALRCFCRYSPRSPGPLTPVPCLTRHNGKLTELLNQLFFWTWRFPIKVES